jgi:hypothetical protein
MIDVPYRGNRDAHPFRQLDVRELSNLLDLLKGAGLRRASVLDSAANKWLLLYSRHVP